MTQTTSYIIGITLVSIYCAIIVFSPWSPINVRTSVKRLFSMKQSKNTLKSLHALRVLTICWVASGHTMNQFFAQKKTKNLIEIAKYELEEHPLLNVWNNATYSVDTFFVIGGLLVGYLYSKRDYSKVNKLKVVLKAIFRRFLRLSPALGMYILFGIIFYSIKRIQKSLFDSSLTEKASISVYLLLYKSKGAKRHCFNWT